MKTILGKIKKNIKTILQIIYHILRYHNKIKVDYDLKIIPNFESTISNLFLKK